jgi:hypothetical protein
MSGALSVRAIAESRIAFTEARLTARRLATRPPGVRAMGREAAAAKQQIDHTADGPKPSTRAEFGRSS